MRGTLAELWQVFADSITDYASQNKSAIEFYTKHQVQLIAINKKVKVLRVHNFQDQQKQYNN